MKWDEEQEMSARDRVRKQASKPMSLEEQERYHREAAEFWNTFYRNNVNKFFKDRQWLGIEFPELIATTKLNVRARFLFYFAFIFFFLKPKIWLIQLIQLIYNKPGGSEENF